MISRGLWRHVFKCPHAGAAVHLKKGLLFASFGLFVYENCAEIKLNSFYLKRRTPTYVLLCKHQVRETHNQCLAIFPI